MPNANGRNSARPWTVRAAALAEARDDLRARAERAERDLDAARAELARARAAAAGDDSERVTGRRRRRGEQPPQG